jgi:hypothetical protein
MRELHNLLRQKESELLKLTKEIEALRTTIRLLEGAQTSAPSQGSASEISTSSVDTSYLPAKQNTVRQFP